MPNGILTGTTSGPCVRRLSMRLSQGSPAGQDSGCETRAHFAFSEDGRRGLGAVRAG